MGNHHLFTNHAIAGRKLEAFQGGNDLNMFDPVSLPLGRSGPAFAEKSAMILNGTGAGLWQKAERSSAESGAENRHVFKFGPAEDLYPIGGSDGLLREYADEKTLGFNPSESDFEVKPVEISYIGGPGDDTFFLNDNENYYVNLSEGGNNQVIMDAGIASAIIGGGGDDLILVRYGAQAKLISLNNGGNNIIGIRNNSVVDEIIGGSGDDSIDIRGDGARAEMIDLTNGGNNDVFTEEGTVIIGGAGNDRIVFQPTFQNSHGFYADLTAGGNNVVSLRGAMSLVLLGAGDDIVEVTNEWGHGGHPGNWSYSTIDLSLGGTNKVDIRGNTKTSGPTRADITLGSGSDTIVAHDHTVVKIRGENSTGNHTISLNGSAGEQGWVHTGYGHTTINWNAGNYSFEFGSGDLTFRTGGDLHYRFVFDGSGRTANDHFILNNWREGGEIYTGEGHTTIEWNYGYYEFQFGSGDLTFTTGGELQHRFVFNGADRTANDTLILNNWREGGVIYTGHGHTDVTLNYGNYEFHIGSGSVSINVNGHQGFSTIYDVNGHLIVSRVDGQSSDADAVHTFSAFKGMNLHYSIQLGHGIDKVQFYAQSGHYQVTSSANKDIFQLDFLTGNTVGATYEVFDFKWDSDQIFDENGESMMDFVFSDFSFIRFEYLGETADGHAFNLVAVDDAGNYEAGHVWMTVYSYDLPDLNFI